MRKLATLRTEGARLLREYRDVEGDREATPQILRDLAAVLVEMREHFVTDDGTPDWTGKTYGYRQTIREVYSTAGVTGSDVSRIQAALREKVDEETLADLGIRASAPIERAREQRAKRSAQLMALRGGDPDGFREVDALRALEASRALLARVDAKSIRELPASGRKAAEGILDSIAGRLDAIEPRRKAAKKATR